MNEAAIRLIIGEQANDEGLWFQAETCAEAYVQAALRRLHEAIEAQGMSIQWKPIDAATESITVPRKQFNALIDWYMREQKNPATAKSR